MKVKVLVIALLAITLVGCESVSEVKADESGVREISGDYVKNYTDPETGICYLVYNTYYGGGITVRYNADGSIMTKGDLND